MTKISPKRLSQLAELEKEIKYEYKDKALLNVAMTHSSFVGNKSENMEHNERLEFIGDSILNMIVSLHLYQTCKDIPEGQLTRMRASIVCEPSLHTGASKLSLGKYLLLSRGEENTGGRKRASILADAFEALVASMFLDGGIEQARVMVLEILHEIIKDSIHNRVLSDYKSYLQEQIQKDAGNRIEYKLIHEEGPDHDKTFEMAVYLNDELVGNGSGRSKKDAQQAAAKSAIEKLEL